MKPIKGWGWALLALMVGYNAGSCTTGTALADASTRTERALERIARALEGRCES